MFIVRKESSDNLKFMCDHLDQIKKYKGCKNQRKTCLEPSKNLVGIYVTVGTTSNALSVS